MAMNGNNLGDAIKTAVMAVVDNLGQSSDPAGASAHQTALFRAIGNAVVDHIKDNAVVAVTNTPSDGAAHTHAPATGDIS